MLTDQRRWMNGMMKCRAARKNVWKLLRKFRKSLDRLVCRTIAVLEENIKKMLQHQKKKKSSMKMC